MSSPQSGKAPNASDRPNILCVVSEDCPPRFGCYGDPLAHTPNVDRLAERGVTFEQAFCSAPVCAPSRFALITGIASESNAPANQHRAVGSVPRWMQTYPEILRSLGYYCTNNFKTDYNSDIDPDLIWDDCSATATWRNRPEGAPFLAVFNFDGTHESSVFGRQPFVVDPDDIVLPPYLPDIPAVREDFAQHYRKIADFDDFVGLLLRLLETDGLTHKTIVIHTSDHGGVTPRSKRYCYDEGLHVPLLVAAPDRFADLFPPPGSRVDAPVCTIRIPPTLVDLAGGEIPSYMQGTSLARRKFDADKELAFAMRNRMDERYDVIRTVRDVRFRYIKNYHPHRPLGQHQAFGWEAAGYQVWEEEYLAGRLDDVQSTFWRPKAGIELYDTVADPHEIHNLAGNPEFAEVEQRLSGALRDHLLEVYDNGFLAEGSSAEGYDASREPEAYPLDRVLRLADLVVLRDRANLPELLSALDERDPTVRRWAAIGVLAMAEADSDTSARLRAALLVEQQPSVVIPCAEALARYTGDAHAVVRLAALVGAEYSMGERLEALSALTALDVDAVRPFRDAIVAASDDSNVDISSAGRYLLLRLDGTYTPRSPTFAWEKLVITDDWANPYRWPDEATDRS